MSQLIDRRLHIRAHGPLVEHVGIIAARLREQRLDGRTDALDDGAEVGGLARVWLAQLRAAG